jgi:hypothetical protein
MTDVIAASTNEMQTALTMRKLLAVRQNLDEEGAMMKRLRTEHGHSCGEDQDCSGHHASFGHSATTLEPKGAKAA